MKKAKVIVRSKDEDGNIVGVYDNNLMLNTMIYDVEIPDGKIENMELTSLMTTCMLK